MDAFQIQATLKRIQEMRLDLMKLHDLRPDSQISVHFRTRRLSELPWESRTSGIRAANRICQDQARVADAETGIMSASWLSRYSGLGSQFVRASLPIPSRGLAVLVYFGPGNLDERVGSRHS